MAKPNEVPEWATDDDFATGPAPVIGTPTKVDPGALSGQGFVPGTAAAAQIMNWLLNRNGRWAKWLDELISSDDGEDVSIARKTLTLFAASRADIIAGSVLDAYARLRGDGTSSHVVASAVEEAVYAALTSWSTDERARLTLRGAIREIRGRDVAGANAPVTIPHGLNVGTSFMPPAGYLPGEPVYFTAPGTFTYSLPSGARAAVVELVGGGGGGSNDVLSRGVGGGGGAFRKCFFYAWPGWATLVVGAGGKTASPGASDATSGEDSSFKIDGILAAVAPGGGTNGSGGNPGPHANDVVRLRGFDGSRVNDPGDGAVTAIGGASGAGWSAGQGGSILVGGIGAARNDGADGIAVITPYF